MPETVNRSISYEIDRIPKPLAEDIDKTLAKVALRKFEMKRSPNGVLRSAWNYAEYALSSKSSEKSEREEYFHTSQLLTAMVLNDSKTQQDTALNALTLSTYLPLFEKRANDTELTGEDCEATYYSLGAAMRYLRPLEVDEPPQWRMAEVGILALSARARQPHLIMYPTSPREEASVIQELNHDSYFFDTNGKILIQQKLLPTQKTYDECIKILTLQPMLDLALRKNGGRTPASLADKVNYLLALIISETSGVALSRDEIKFLNSMTEAVVAHYFNALEAPPEKFAA